MATAPYHRNERRVVRDIVSSRTRLTVGLAKADGLMVDLSPFGCMMRSAATVAPGDRIAVTLPILGSRAARVVWALGGRLGVEFLDPIPVGTYGALLAAMPTDHPGWNEL